MVGLVFVRVLMINSGLSSKHTFFVVIVVEILWSIVSRSSIVWRKEGSNSSSMLNILSFGGVGWVSDSENFRRMSNKRSDGMSWCDQR